MVIVSGILVAGFSGCSRPGGIGVGGNYNDGVLELGKTQRGGNARKAIVHLEYVVRRNPRYKDSLTQLGRAYYYAGRYGSAFEVLKRAVALNSEDEIGWLVLGLTQMQRGKDDAGLDSFKGGLTLLAKATREGYREIPDEFWDTRGVVRRALRRSISLARKGVAEKLQIIQSGELLLHRVDRELYDAEQIQSHSEYLDGKRDLEKDQ
ncbi:MAG: hypothetical protein OXE53_05570 [Deltaproteobacteria bacterium]|nr:hypothetical protein [Deltaproteobacteria bacterium]